MKTTRLSFRAAIALVGLYAFFVQFKPSEPFMFQFLTSEKNLSASEVVGDIFPLSTYGQLVAQPLLGLIPELLSTGVSLSLWKYRFPYALAVIVGSISFFVTSLMLTEAQPRDFLILQLQEITYALGFATIPLFTAYLFRLMRDRRRFLVTISVTKAITLFSISLSGFLGQVLETYFNAPLRSVYVVSTVCLGIAIAFAVLLLLPAFAYESHTLGIEEGDKVISRAVPWARESETTAQQTTAESLNRYCSDVEDSEKAAAPNACSPLIEPKADRTESSNQRGERPRMFPTSVVRRPSGERYRRIYSLLKEFKFYFSHVSVVQLAVIYTFLGPAHYLCMTLWQALVGRDGAYNGYVVSGAYLLAALINFVLGPLSSHLIRRGQRKGNVDPVKGAIAVDQGRSSERCEEESITEADDTCSQLSDAEEEAVVLLNPRSRGQVGLAMGVMPLALCLLGMGLAPIVGDSPSTHNASLASAAAGSASPEPTAITPMWTVMVYFFFVIYHTLYEAVLTLTTVRLGRLLSVLSVQWNFLNLTSPLKSINSAETADCNPGERHLCGPSATSKGERIDVALLGPTGGNAAHEVIPPRRKVEEAYEATRARYALTLGLLSTVSLAFQTIVQLILARRSSTGDLILTVPFQFIILSSIVVFSSLAVLLMGLSTKSRCLCSRA